jgi:hypothetical protein
VLGYVGAALQLGILGVALLRGLRARTLAGATLAAIAALVLAGRPSLALLENGNSALAFGVALGFVCALPMKRSKARRPVSAPRARAAQA